MLRSLNEILGYRVETLDGVLGRVKDFLFDDQSWGIQYLAVDTGDWLLDGRVLIAPQTAREPVWSSGVIPVTLTKEQVASSPGIESHVPVSRRYERWRPDYYSWQLNWLASSPLGIGAPGILMPVTMAQAEEPDSQPAPEEHLQSARDVTGYRAGALDGEVGRVADFLVLTETWVIRYLVVETRRWIPGRKVLVSPAWVTRMDWPEKRLHMDLNREEIRNSVAFDPSAPVNREREVRLYDYYGRPRYRKEAGEPAGKWYREDRRTIARHWWKARSRARQAPPLRTGEHDDARETQASSAL